MESLWTFIPRGLAPHFVTVRWASWYVRESVSLALDWLSKTVAPKEWHD